MKEFPTEKIRNVVLLGHGGSGKTTLAEALLHVTGAISRKGRVEDGNTVCDFTDEEKARGFSLSLALAPFEWGDHKVNLLDAPGYADFEFEALAALRVADLAIFVVSAVDGVQVQTESLWRAAEQFGTPRMVFVNKLDRERSDFAGVLDQLRDRFGAGIAPTQLPVGEEHDHRGVADLLRDRAFVYENGKPNELPIPEDLREHEEQVRESLVEGIVVADDELLERYLEGEVPDSAELEKTLARGVSAGTVFPVMCGSALLETGVDLLARAVCDLGPSPADRPPVGVRAGSEEVDVSPDPSADPLAFVFKTIVDPYVGQISVFKVLSGTIRPDTTLVVPRTGAEARIHALMTLRGKEQVTVPSIPAGDIGAAAKLQGVHTGDTLAPKGKPVSVQPIEFPEPVLTIAIRAKSQADEDKLANALARVLEADPALRMERNEETQQTLLHGMGEAHLNLAIEKLRSLGADVEVEELQIPYRETITGTAEAEGKYKKQTGGHGQFGVCYLRVEPLPRGAGFEFVDQIVGGAIPRQFIPAVQKGIEETMAEGGVFGYPVMDVRVTCFDGKYHPVDSSELSFKMAGRLGFKAALEKASPVLLEPISALEVTVPQELQGDVMGDLNARRGRVQGTELSDHGEVTIFAEVPTAELKRYATELRSITGGRGRFKARHSHYDFLPPNLVDQVRRSRPEGG
ncbi:MAG: elongation factor G [Acidimicrobiales bacterium]|nr:MAG: elongation factor G [Acidimicrobiales bacterium]